MTQTAEAITEEQPVSLSIQVSNDPEDDSEESVQLVPSSEDDIFVIANSPAQMAQSQMELIKWAERRIRALRREKKIAEENLEEAKNLKIKTGGWKSQVKRWEKRILYYTKVHAALEAGYFIVPDFPVNTIAVRTTKTEPSDQSYHSYESSIGVQKSQELAIGEGEYKDPHPLISHEVVSETGSDGKEHKKTQWFTTGSLQTVDFPFRLIRPRILKDLNRALQNKLFDEIGVLPNKRRTRDPMLIGTIRIREGAYSSKSISFLISWWIPTQDL